MSYLNSSDSSGMVVSGGGGRQPATQLCGMDREARVLRYREKRKNRKFEKTIFHPGYDLMSSYANKRRQGIFWRVRIRLRKVVCSVWMAEVWHWTLFLKWWLLAGCSYSIWVFLQVFRFRALMLWDYGVPVCALVSFFYVVLDCDEARSYEIK